MIPIHYIELTNYILSIHDPILFDKERIRIAKLLKKGVINDSNWSTFVSKF